MPVPRDVLLHLLIKAGITHITVTDSTGVIYRGRKGMPQYKNDLARMTNPDNVHELLADAIAGADAIIGVSGPGTITRAHVESMAKDAIVFALANPLPENKAEDALTAGARAGGDGSLTDGTRSRFTRIPRHSSGGV